MSETSEPDYGPETIVDLPGGFTLRAPAFPLECDFVRVCRPDGSEMTYWTCDEWAEDPMDVMGAIVGAMRSGYPKD